MFGKRAETMAEYLKKGQRVFIRGEYTIKQWAKDGKSGVDVDVTVDEVELLGDKKPEADSGSKW
jgi:single-stranded DNA-binding protein